jgi:hypothetical protein
MIQNEAGFQQFLLALLREHRIVWIQAEEGECAFIVLCDGYPEISIDPAPWCCQPRDQELMAFLGTVRFEDVQSLSSTPSGPRFRILLRLGERTFELRVRRLRALLDQIDLTR